MSIIIALSLVCLSRGLADELFSYIHGESNHFPTSVANQSTDEIIAKVRNRVWVTDADTVGKLNESTHVFAGGRLQSAYYYYIPQTYNGFDSLPVLIYLHGRVTHAVPGQGKASFSRWQQWCDKYGYILILPSGQREFPWWSPLGEAHVFECLRYVTGKYRIDHNRVFLSGVSDGGSGTYSLAMRNTDRFAGGVSWLGSLQVNRDRLLGNSPLYVGNCKSIPWRVVTGGLDKVYPMKSQESTIKHLSSSGISVQWKNYKELSHDDQAVFESDSEALGSWLGSIKRDSAPVKLDWTVHNPTRYGQHYWIQVQGLKSKNEEKLSEQLVLPRVMTAVKRQKSLGVHFLDDTGEGLRVSACDVGSVGEAIGLLPWDVVMKINDLDLDQVSQWNEYWQSGSKDSELLVRRNDSELRFPVRNRRIRYQRESPVIGRIVAERKANRVSIQSQNVASFDVLVSPDLFDLTKEIVVVVNGLERYRGRISADKSFMLGQLRKRNGDHSVIYVNYIPIKFDPFVIGK